jgi:hypothetical protein
MLLLVHIHVSFCYYQPLQQYQEQWYPLTPTNMAVIYITQSSVYITCDHRTVSVQRGSCYRNMKKIHPQFSTYQSKMEFWVSALE